MGLFQHMPAAMEALFHHISREVCQVLFQQTLIAIDIQHFRLSKPMLLILDANWYHITGFSGYTLNLLNYTILTTISGTFVLNVGKKLKPVLLNVIVSEAALFWREVLKMISKLTGSVAPVECKLYYTSTSKISN